MEEDYKNWPASLRKAMIGLRKSSGCGANKQGGGGFQPGNSCAAGGVENGSPNESSINFDPGNAYKPPGNREGLFYHGGFAGNGNLKVGNSKGIYFTDNEDIAAEHTERYSGDDAGVLKVQLNTGNMLDAGAKDPKKSLSIVADALEASGETESAAIVRDKASGGQASVYEVLESEEVSAAIKRHFDSMKFADFAVYSEFQSIVVFDPHNVNILERRRNRTVVGYEDGEEIEETYEAWSDEEALKLFDDDYSLPDAKIR